MPLTWRKHWLPALGLPLVALLLSSSAGQNLGEALRYSFDARLLLVLALLYVAFRAPWAAWLGPLVTVGLFWLALAGLWSPVSAELQVLSGLVFFSDSAQYTTDALRLLNGGLFTWFSARHPLPGGLLAALLGLGGGNLQLALIALVGLTGTAAGLAANEVRRLAGPAAAALFTLGLFLFYRRFAGLPDAENLGLALGSLSFALLLRAARPPLASHFNQRDLSMAKPSTNPFDYSPAPRFAPPQGGEGGGRGVGESGQSALTPAGAPGAAAPGLALLGLLSASLALNARPSAFLLLPALLLWAAVWARRRWFAAAALTALLAGFALNALLLAVTSPPGQPLFSNYTYTLYGIAAGGQGWEQFFRDYPQYANDPGPAGAQAAWDEALRLLRLNPLNAARGAALSFLGYFSLRDESLFGFVSGGDLGSFNHPDPALAGLYALCRLAAWLLFGSGLLWLVAHRRAPASGLLLAGAAGLLASLLFIPARDAGVMRVYAAVIPWLLAVAVLPLGALRPARTPDPLAVLPPDLPVGAGGIPTTPISLNPPPCPAPRRDSFPAGQSHPAGLLVFAALLLGLTLLGPLGVRLTARAPALPSAACPAGSERRVVSIGRGSYVLIADPPAGRFADVYAVSPADFRRSLARLPYGGPLLRLANLPTPALLALTYDLPDGPLFWLALSGPDPARLAGRVSVVCGHWNQAILNEGLGVFEAEIAPP